MGLEAGVTSTGMTPDVVTVESSSMEIYAKRQKGSQDKGIIVTNKVVTVN